MKKKIITRSIVIVIIVLFGYYLDKECGVKTVKMQEKAQLGLTGIYLTVLDYKEIEPLKDDPKLDYDKYIAFEVMLEGSKRGVIENFGHSVSSNPDQYDLCGLFFLDGEKDGKKQFQGMLDEDYIIKLFGPEFPAIGIGKMGDDKIAHGYVVFGIPERFKPYKFVYKFYTKAELYQIIFPDTEIHVILEDPVS